MNSISFVKSLRELPNRYRGEFQYTKQFAPDQNVDKGFRCSVLNRLKPEKKILNPLFEKDGCVWYFACKVVGTK